MIFHPPLLFLGYAGYTIPCCLALASRLSGDGKDWLDLARNWNIVALVTLTAGIILGAPWWSYMELGWGGYWAWDPVENASRLSRGWQHGLLCTRPMMGALARPCCGPTCSWSP